MNHNNTEFDAKRIELLIAFMRAQSGTDAPAMDFFAALSGRLSRFGHDISKHGLVLSEEWKKSGQKTVSIIEFNKPSCEMKFTVAEDNGDTVVIKRTGRQYKAQSFQMPQQSEDAISEVFMCLIEALPDKTRDSLYEKVTQTPRFRDEAAQKFYDLETAEAGTFSKGLPPKEAGPRSYRPH